MAFLSTSATPAPAPPTAPRINEFAAMVVLAGASGRRVWPISLGCPQFVPGELTVGGTTLGSISCRIHGRRQVVARLVPIPLQLPGIWKGSIPGTIHAVRSEIL